MPAPAENEREHEKMMIREAEGWTLINMRKRRTDPDYRVDATDLKDAELKAAEYFAAHPMCAELILYAVKGHRQSQIARVFPPGTTKFPVMPGRYKVETRFWVPGAQGWKPED